VCTTTAPSSLRKMRRRRATSRVALDELRRGAATRGAFVLAPEASCGANAGDTRGDDPDHRQLGEALRRAGAVAQGTA